MPRNKRLFYRKSEHAFNWIIARYGTTLQWVLRRQRLTLMVMTATIALTLLLFFVVPKGFFPGAGYRCHFRRLASSRKRFRLRKCGHRQQALAKVILQDPAVESLSSFIGIDGINTTLNSGRIQINLKPMEQRLNSSDVIRRLQGALSRWTGSHSTCSRYRI